MKRMPRWVKRTTAIVGLLLILGALAAAGGLLWLNARFEASLPRLSGSTRLAGLSAPVRVERDRNGVPTLTGVTREDLARATGFIHGQERFFQMDLLRRAAAGELAELFGSPALPADRAARIHRFRARSHENVAGLGGEELRLLESYAEGVNAGLADLGAVPPEYVVLRQDPAPWRPEDSMLVALAMYRQLQGDDGSRESLVGLVRELLPAELADFLVPVGSSWDAPIEGPPIPTPPIPGPEVFDLRDLASAPAASAARVRRDGPAWDETSPGEAVLGSNNWAVAGTHSATGAALLANDMHLGHGMPNIWFRLSLVWGGPGEEPRRATGVTLPGFSQMVAGSNGHIAWGFTNTEGDWHDLVIIEPHPDDPDRYRTPDGWRAFERVQETIAVKGGPDEPFEVRSTIWGPVIDKDHRGRERALRWVAHDAAGVNPGLEGLLYADTVDDAVAVAPRCGIPHQNLVVADRQGRIAWVVAGRIPRRTGHDGRVPTSWADGERGWAGWLGPDEYPRVVDPPSGRIWTANNRVAGEEKQALIGHGGYSDGARAAQIRDDLVELERASVEDMLRIQLDDRALLLAPWREWMLGWMTDTVTAGNADRGEFRRLVADDWTGRASVDSAGYRMVRAFRYFLAQRVFESITAPCRQADPGFQFLSIGRWEGPLWKLVQERPEHLLDPEYESWDALFGAALDETLAYFLDGDDRPLAQRTWGEHNTIRIRHPLSRAVPQLSRWLDIPPLQLPGDSGMPRAQGAGWGASERLAVSPGREDEGYFHMPAGQSGHFKSPFYRAGHEDWAGGKASPFLPGPAEYELALTP